LVHVVKTLLQKTATYASQHIDKVPGKITA